MLARKGLALPTELIPWSTWPFSDPVAWKIIREYATTDQSWPDTEICLQAHLSDTFDTADWEPVLQAISEEEDLDMALKDIDDLEQAEKWWSGLTIHIPASHPPQLITVETDLINMVQNLKSRKHIFGELMTADEILNPPEEWGNENEEYSADTDVVTAIVEEVQHEIAVEKGEVIEVQSDDGDEANEPLSC